MLVRSLLRKKNKTNKTKQKKKKPGSSLVISNKHISFLFFYFFFLFLGEGGVGGVYILIFIEHYAVTTEPISVTTLVGDQLPPVTTFFMKSRLMVLGFLIFTVFII